MTTDEHAIYLDVDGSSRIRLGDFQEFASLNALKANTNPSTTALYYISDINCLAKWNGSEYIQINLDTGATVFEVVGSGNAITAVAYDSATRKLTLTKGETFATKAFVGSIPEGYTETNVIEYVNKKAEETLSAASGGSTESAASVKGALDTYIAKTDPRLEALEQVDHEHTNMDVLNGITAEKVSAWEGAEQNAKDYANEQIKALSDGQVTTNKNDIAGIKNGTAVNNFAAAETAIADAKKAGTDAMAEAQTKVASVTGADASVTIGGTATAPTVAVKVSQDADNSLQLAEDGLKVIVPAAAEYVIEKATNSGEFAAVYTLMKDGVQVGAAINIPKDMVVESGSVVENPEGQAEGTYIELKLQNVTDPLYINVGNLIEYVTSGSQTGDMVVISVSDDHKVTAEITDGTITLAKLHTDIQTAIGKAHSHENADVLAGINADKVAAWGAAEQNAKDHADGLNAQMNTRMEAVEGKAHEHANKAELDKIVEGDKAKWDAAAEKAHEHANQAELDLIATGDKAKWDTAAADAAAIKADYLKADDKTELQGNIDTLAGKVYTKTEVENAIAAAALTWGSF